MLHSVRLSFRNMNLSEDRLLATDPVDRFLRYRLSIDFAELRPIIVRMLRSSDPGVQVGRSTFGHLRRSAGWKRRGGSR